ncbi:hypothetical protein MIT9_P2473 [Methylomarinovum caldicuralii]|uniref:Lipoprotein n=1 Tax=Methylomarinovum caldicuralii TaxID=438856 RepID=A0AAU9CXZ2_9GAMM|nr:Lpp/OprI family alanine-zipper lipoprotein [Methylomarinovum caldicuralii]BCX82882.1 hypothetical protein MIT9_P2473 [Methylomarinovum caldicuralii]
MKTLTKIFAITAAMALMTGCATQKSALEHLRSEVHELDAKISMASDTANKALSEATAAHEHAAEAEALAKECKQICAAHGAHMEKMFQKSMMK